MSQESKLSVLRSLLARVQTRAAAARGAPVPGSEAAHTTRQLSEVTQPRETADRESAVHVARAPVSPIISADADGVQALAVPTLTQGDLIAEGGEPEVAPMASLPAAFPQDAASPHAPAESVPPPSAPRLRHADSELEQVSLDDEDVASTPISVPPASGRQVASAPAALREEAPADEALDDIDIAIEVPDPLGAPRVSLDSIDLTAQESADSVRAPEVQAAAGRSATLPEAGSVATPPTLPLPQAPAEVPSADSTAPITALSRAPSQRELPAAAVVEAERGGARPTSSQPPRLEIIDDHEESQRAPLAHLEDPFPPPAASRRTPQPPALPQSLDEPASDAPPTRWSEAPPPPVDLVAAAGVPPLPDAPSPVRLMVNTSSEGDRAPVEVWASTYAPHLKTGEVAQFLGASRSFVPATFGELLDATLKLGE